MNFAIGVIHDSRFTGRFYQLSQMPKCVSMILGCVCYTCEILSSNIKWQKCKGHKTLTVHDDVIKWKHFPRCWPYVHMCGEFNAQRPVTWSFDISFDLHLNKRLSQQWWGWWFEMSLHPLWRHCKGHYHNNHLVCTHSDNWAPMIMNHFIKFYYFMRYKLQNQFQIFNLK